MPVKSKESVGPCEVSLDIEVESARVADAVDKAYREFSKYIQVPGFRKGKAPMAFVKQRVPQDQLRERTAEILVGPAYDEAIRANEIQPYARPRVELLKLETVPPDYVFEFKAIVPLAPKVELGAYQGLAVNRERIEVADADVDKRIDAVRERVADYPLIEGRPAQAGDIIVGDLSITPEDADYDEGDFQPTAITLGDPGNIPGVDDALIDPAVGDERRFELSYPADYPNADVAGKSAKFIFQVRELRSKALPALDDEFAKKYGGVETLDEMRRKARADMEKTQTEAAQSLMESQLIDRIVAGSKIEFPTVLLDVEMEEDIRSFREDIEKRDMTVQDYLERAGIDEERLLSDFRNRAEVRLRRGLVLGEIARTEGMELTEEDVANEIQRRADESRGSVEAMRAYLDRSGGMEALRNQAFTRKVIGLIASSAAITDVVSAPGASQSDAAPSRSIEESVQPAPSKSKSRAKAGSAAPASEAAGQPSTAETASDDVPKSARTRKKKDAAEGIEAAADG